MKHFFRTLALSIGLFLCVTVSAGSIPLKVVPAPDGGYTLTGKRSDGSIVEFQAYCLDFNRPAPSEVASYEWTSQPSGVNPALLQKAIWIARAAVAQGVSRTDAQSAIWRLFDGGVSLSEAARRLYEAGLATSPEPALPFDLLAPSNGETQRYLITSVVNGAAVAEPATLLLLGGGLASLAGLMKRRAR